MKKLFSYAFLCALTLSTTFISCKKDSDSGGSGGGGGVSAGNLTAGQAVVKATISGTYSTNYESTTLVSKVTKSAGLIFITSLKQPTSANADIDQFIIYLPADIQTGAYKATDFTGGAGIFTFSHTTNMTNTTGWQADPEGETTFNIQITKATDTEIEGTFNGEMTNDTDATKITANGSFAAKY